MSVNVEVCSLPDAEIVFNLMCKIKLNISESYLVLAVTNLLTLFLIQFSGWYHHWFVLPVFYFERPDFLWSGWLQRASFSVFTLSKVTSGPMESYCGRFSRWVTMATLSPVLNIGRDSKKLSGCAPVQGRVPTQMLPWIPTSTRWSKMAATWPGQTLPQLRCEQAGSFLFMLIKLFWI